jgi:hypothetical protein
LPDGKHFLYLARSASPDQTSIYLRTLGSDESQRLVGAYSSVAYLPPYLLYVRGDTLMAQVFDGSRLELSGEPLPAVERVGSFVATGKAYFSVSENGVLGYHPHITEHVLPVWFDRQGRRLGTLGSPEDYSDLSLSPDGNTLAFGRVDLQTSTGDIWLMDLPQGTTSRFTSHLAHDYRPIWAGDGSRIVFSSNRMPEGRGLYQKLSSAAGQEELLLPSGGVALYATDWSTDGRFILYEALDPRTNYDLWALPLEGDRKPIALVQTPFSEMNGVLSPDGRWLAYSSNESGRHEIYVRLFLRPGGSRLISTGGGVQPTWRGDGRELFYLSPQGGVMSVSVDPGESTLRADVPRSLFDEPTVLMNPLGRSYSFPEMASVSSSTPFSPKPPRPSRSS